MYTRYFTVLGIEETDNLDEIKKAYAYKLQTIDEEDVLALSAVHEAYQILKKRIATPTKITITQTYEHTVEKPSISYTYDPITQNPIEQNTLQIQQPIDDVEIQTENWKTYVTNIQRQIPPLSSYDETAFFSDVVELHDIFETLSVVEQSFVLSDIERIIESLYPMHFPKNTMGEKLAIDFLHQLEWLAKFHFISKEDVKKYIAPPLISAGVTKFRSIDRKNRFTSSYLDIEKDIGKPKVTKPSLFPSIFMLFIGLIALISLSTSNSSTKNIPPLDPSFTATSSSCYRNITKMKNFEITYQHFKDNYSITDFPEPFQEQMVKIDAFIEKDRDYDASKCTQTSYAVLLENEALEIGLYETLFIMEDLPVYKGASDSNEVFDVNGE